MIYSASDYAGFESKNLKVYYGYEQVDKNDEWLFVAEFGDTTIKIPRSKLQPLVKGDMPVDYLLAGLAKLFLNYRLI